MLFRILLENDQAYQFAKSLPKRYGMTMQDWIKDKMTILNKLRKIERNIDTSLKLSSTFKPVLTLLEQKERDVILNPSPYRDKKKNRQQYYKQEPRRKCKTIVCPQHLSLKLPPAELYQRKRL